MTYILRRTDQGGGYVAQPGSHNSYTKDPLKARRFPTREAAERDRCPGNEVVVSLDSDPFELAPATRTWSAKGWHKSSC